MINKPDSTDKQYYLLICEECIYEKAKELNIPAVYIPIRNIDDPYSSAIREKKNYVCIFFDPSDDRDFGNIVTRGGYDEWIVACNTYKYTVGDGLVVHSPEEAAKFLPRIIEDIEKFLVDCGHILTTDYEGRCGNCHSIIDKNDRYCRYCGTKRGEGAFAPYSNIMYCVYGPPIKTRFKCDACGHNWEITVLGGDNSKICPQCGKGTIRTVEEIGLDYDEKTMLFKREYPKQEAEKDDDE